jgi:hypothetical protein
MILSSSLITLFLPNFSYKTTSVAKDATYNNLITSLKKECNLSVEFSLKADQPKGDLSPKDFHPRSQRLSAVFPISVRPQGQVGYRRRY